MTAQELIHHTFPWELAPGIPMTPVGEAVRAEGSAAGHPRGPALRQPGLR